MYDIAHWKKPTAVARSLTATPLVALLLVSLCLTRPSLFGQSFNLVGGLGIIAVTCASLLMCVDRQIIIGRRSPERSIAISLFVFWCYVFGYSVFFGNSDIELLLKASAGGFSVPICFLLLSSNTDLIPRTFAIFARVNAILGYSLAITFLLIPIVGYAALRYYTYTIVGYDDATGVSGNGDILLPFSVVYGSLTEYGIFRFCGIYREAGLAQAFFVWSFIFLVYSRARFAWIAGAFLGALFCGSTAVVFSLASAAIIHFGSQATKSARSLFILLGLMIGLTLVALFAPGLGLVDKAVTHGSSLTDRREAMEMALPSADIVKWFFGHGMFFDGPSSVQNVGINAISSIFHYGVVGLLLYVATFFAGVYGASSRSQAIRYFTLISPILVTSLFFQPIVDAPLAIAILFCMPQEA
jgi:hypothetical protein